MKRLRIYLDTSVINFLFAEDAPDFMKVTREFFEHHVREARYAVFVSDVVLREIEKTPDAEKRGILFKVVQDYGLSILTLSAEAEDLAKIYVRDGVIPERKLDDAMHIAIATCQNIDVLLSWNFRHLANFRKQLAIRSINEREGYLHPLVLANPTEVLDEDD